MGEDQEQEEEEEEEEDEDLRQLSKSNPGPDDFSLRSLSLFVPPETTAVFCQRIIKMTETLRNLKSLAISSFFMRLDMKQIRKALIEAQRHLPHLKELVLPTPILASIEFYEAHIDLEDDQKKKPVTSGAKSTGFSPFLFPFIFSGVIDPPPCPCAAVDPQHPGESEDFLNLMKLVTSINFQFYMTTAKPASFAYVASLCPNVVFIELSSCKIRHSLPFPENLISLKFFSCKFMLPPEEELDGKRMPFLEEFLVENCTGFRGASISSLIHCHQLAILRVSKLSIPNTFLESGIFPQLISLAFGSEVSGNELKMGAFIRRHLAKLGTLEIGIPTPSLIKGLVGEDPLPLPCNLDVLHIGCFTDKDEPLNVSPRQLRDALWVFSKTKKLEILNFENLTANSLSGPLFNTLQELTLEYVGLEAEEVSEVIASSPALLHLQIDYPDETADRRLVISSQSLRKIDVPVETCSVVILNGCPKLQELNIFDENGLVLRYIQAKTPLPHLQKIDLSYIPFARDFWRNTLPSLVNFGPSIINIHLSRVPRDLLQLLRRDKIAYLFFFNSEPFIRTLKTRTVICSMVLDTLSKHPDWRFELAPKGSSSERKVYKINQPGHGNGYVETNFPEFFIADVDETKIQNMNVADFQAFAVKFTEPILHKLYPLHRILFITAEDVDRGGCPFDN